MPHFSWVRRVKFNHAQFDFYFIPKYKYMALHVHSHHPGDTDILILHIVLYTHLKYFNDNVLKPAG